MGACARVGILPNQAARMRLPERIPKPLKRMRADPGGRVGARARVGAADAGGQQHSQLPASDAVPNRRRLHAQIPEGEWARVRESVLQMLAASSSRSSKPAIFGAAPTPDDQVPNTGFQTDSGLPHLVCSCLQFTSPYDVRP